jgi:hypothetical protein
MGFFTTRERAELDKLAEVEGEIRDFVRERHAVDDDGQRVAGNLASLINRVAGSTIDEIDQVTARLQTLRGQLQAQGERVQRDVVEYAALSQSAIQSTRIIADNLARWKATNAPADRMSDDAGEPALDAGEFAPPTVPTQDNAND